MPFSSAPVVTIQKSSNYSIVPKWFTVDARHFGCLRVQVVAVYKSSVRVS